MSTAPDLLTTDEAARRLGLAPWTVRQMVRQGRLRAFRLGGGPRGRLRFRVEDVDAVLARA